MCTYLLSRYKTFLKTQNTAELEVLLQQLNYQRAWLDVKIQNLESGNMLTDPANDQLQVQQKALETAFLKEFPILGKQFFRKLKKLLKQKMTVVSDFGIQKPGELPRPKFASLKKSVISTKTTTPTKTVKQLELFIRGHPAADRLRDAEGNYVPPHFTKQAVEEIVGHKVSCMTLNKVQKSLALAPKKIKRRKRKSIRRQGL